MCCVRYIFEASPRAVTPEVICLCPTAKLFAVLLIKFILHAIKRNVDPAGQTRACIGRSSSIQHMHIGVVSQS